MMFGWPLKRRGFRIEERDYTAAILHLRQQAAADASNASAAEAANAAEEVVCGLYERAFMQASIVGINVERRIMGMVGRALARNGELVVDALTMAPAATADVRGGPSPLAWRYLLTLSAPSGSRDARRNAMDVWHFRANASEQEPWRGRSPFDLSPATRDLLKRTEASLSSEATGAVGKILTVPSGTPDATIEKIKTDLRTLLGKTALLESTAGGWGQGAATAPAQDWRPTRLGPEPPSPQVELRRDAALMVLAAAGVPVELVTGAEGAGAREAWRRFLHSTIQPLGEGVAEELRLKTGRRIAIDFDALMASDLAGRARAFQSMVAAGMDMERSAALAGLMVDGD